MDNLGVDTHMHTQPRGVTDDKTDAGSENTRVTKLASDKNVL